MVDGKIGFAIKKISYEELAMSREFWGFVVFFAILALGALIQYRAYKAQANYKKTEAKTGVKAIVICCSDPRFDMFDRIRERYSFGPGECFPIVVPGGPDPLANPELMNRKCQAEETDLDIILEHSVPSMTTVIVAQHEDCACIKHFGAKDPHQGKKDFPTIAEFFAQRAPQLKLEMLYYSFSDQKKGVVNPIPEVIKID